MARGRRKSIDPVLVACHIGTALQSIVSRNVSPRDTAVLSVTRILSGDAYNVIPQTATLGGTVRTMKRETMTLVEQGMRRIVSGVAAGFGATAEVDFRLIFAPLVNHEAEFHAIADAAAELVGDANVNRTQAPASGVGGFRLHAGAGARRLHQSRQRRYARRCTIITTTSTTRRSRSVRRCLRGWSNGSCRAAPNNQRRHPC